MLVTGKSAESEVAEHIYDLILELHSIDSSVLLSVLPQLEFKLRVSEQMLLSVSRQRLLPTFVCRREKERMVLQVDI